MTGLRLVLDGKALANVNIDSQSTATFIIYDPRSLNKRNLWTVWKFYTYLVSYSNLKPGIVNNLRFSSNSSIENIQKRKTNPKWKLGNRKDFNPICNIPRFWSNYRRQKMNSVFSPHWIFLIWVSQIFCKALIKVTSANKKWVLLKQYWRHWTVLFLLRAIQTKKYPARQKEKLYMLKIMKVNLESIESVPTKRLHNKPKGAKKGLTHYFIDYARKKLFVNKSFFSSLI